MILLGSKPRAMNKAGTNRRVPVCHTKPQATVSERPEPRIIEKELREAAQERLKSIRYTSVSLLLRPVRKLIPNCTKAFKPHKV